MRRTLTLLAATLIAGTALAQGRPDLVEQSLRGGRAQFVPGELLVQFKAGTTREAQAAAIAFIRGARKETVLPAARRNDGKGDLHLLKLPQGLLVVDAFRAMSQLADVDFAEPNWIYQHQATSNDPYVTNGSLWGMTGEFGSGASTAWAKNQQNCGSVVVGIIDTGVMVRHTDLAANIWQNPTDKGNGLDEDNNGYTDDINGWDFDGNNNSVYDGTQDSHGTHVAGTIGAIGGNGQGVAGVCWNVKMVSAKFLGRNGGTTANAVKAVDYLTELKAKHNLNLPATNNSWGGGGYSQGLYDAIERAKTANILFVAAAGNSTLNCESSNCYPAEYSNANVIAVASINKDGTISSFSNYGSATIDIGAPGSGIVSTVPSKSGASSYASYNGTSMAAPHVTGAVALYAASNPGKSAAEIKAAILSAAIPTASLSDKVSTKGRLNVSGF